MIVHLDRPITSTQIRTHYAVNNIITIHVIIIIGTLIKLN